MARFWRKIKGEAIINDVDEEEAVEGPAAPPSSTCTTGDNMVELSYEERQEKAAELKYKKKPTCLDIALFDDKVRLVYVLLLCALLGIVVPFILASYAFHKPVNNMRGTCGLNISYRFACVPWDVPLEDDCHALGCCFEEPYGSDQYAPPCFHSVPAEYDYIVDTDQNTTLGPYPITRRMGNDSELVINLSSLRSQTNIGTPAWPLEVKIQRQGNDVVRILLWSPWNDAFSNDDFVPEPGSDSQLDVVVEEDEGGDFNITVFRVSTNETIMETVFGALIYGEKYMEISSKLPTYHLYGLGQRDNYKMSPNYANRERWALYNREEAKAGTTYGSHPFFMNFEKSGEMFGVFLKNSGPVEVGFVPIPAVVFRAVTGMLDLRVLAGPTPRDVTRQYTDMVGRPALPPYWALGYHLCRTSSNTSEYDTVVQLMETLQVPYESDCIDTRLNYPDSFAPPKDATLQRIRQMKNSGRRFILVQYPFVPVGSAAYIATQRSDILLKVNSTTPYYGSVDGWTVGYPDYLDDASFSNWLGQDPTIGDLYDLADGVVLLRNTPLNEVHLNYTVWMEGTAPNCTSSTPENCCPDAGLPFLPEGVNDANNRTLCSSNHHPTINNIPHLNVHNAYGSFHHKRVFQAMQVANVTRRAFVTSQSTHPGSGSYGGHFGGLYLPDFASQMKALVQMLEMGLYGVPMVGVPLCGSLNGTTEELRTEWCLRAHQTGSFWPFMMSYNEFGHSTRNPPNFGTGFINQIKFYIRQRYMVLPYLYTLFYEAHTHGVPVVRPLFYVFPHDLGSRDVSMQFMLGDGLLVTPVFSSMGDGTSVTIQAHFPPGCWYDFYTGAMISDSVNGTDQMLPTLFTDANVHVRGGVVLPLQGNLQDSVTTTAESRTQPFQLLVALSCPSSSPAGGTGDAYMTSFVASASGWLYVDDGITPVAQAPPADQLQMVVTGNNLTVARIPGASEGDGICSLQDISTNVTSVWIFGAPSVKQITVNGINSSFVTEPDSGAIFVSKFNFNWCVEDSLVIVWE